MYKNINKLLTPELYTKYTTFVWLYSILCFYSLIANFHNIYNPLVVSISVLIILFITFMNYKKYCNRKSLNGFIFFLVCYSVVYIISGFIGSPVPISLWILTLFGSTFIAYKQTVQLSIFNCFIKIYCVLLLLSLIEYSFLILTGNGIIVSQVERNLSENTYLFNQYLFNLLLIPLDIARFQSLMHEPGDIGTLNGLLLFGLSLSKKYRFELTIVILSGLVSMSLAFYIMLILYLLISIAKLNIKIIILGSVLFVAMVYLFGEQFEQQIVYRMHERGIEERSEEAIIKTNLKDLYTFNLFGNGNGSVSKRFGNGSDGMHYFIYDFGWFGLTLVLIAFIFCYKNIHKRMVLYDYAFIFVFLLSFYQRRNVYEVQIVMAFVLPALIANYKDCKLLQ